MWRRSKCSMLDGSTKTIGSRGRKIKKTTEEKPIEMILYADVLWTVIPGHGDLKIFKRIELESDVRTRDADLTNRRRRRRRRTTVLYDNIYCNTIV